MKGIMPCVWVGDAKHIVLNGAKHIMLGMRASAGDALHACAIGEHVLDMKLRLATQKDNSTTLETECTGRTCENNENDDNDNTKTNANMTAT